MLNTNDYMTFQSDAIKASNALAGKGIEAMQKLAELNMKVMKSSLESGAEQMKSLMSVKDIKELNETLVTLAQPRSEAFSQYAKDAYAITTEANAEVTKMFEAQVEEGHKQLSTMIDGMAKNAPAGTEGAIGLMKQALTASRTAYEQASKAGKQVVEMAEANLANAGKAAAAAAGTAAKKK
ncbi:MAG: phasin family protein [Burkholderiaceae bacterium]